MPFDDDVSEDTIRDAGIFDEQVRDLDTAPEALGPDGLTVLCRAPIERAGARNTRIFVSWADLEAVARDEAPLEPDVRKGWEGKWANVNGHWTIRVGDGHMGFSGNGRGTSWNGLTPHEASEMLRKARDNGWIPKIADCDAPWRDDCGVANFAPPIQEYDRPVPAPVPTASGFSVPWRQLWAVAPPAEIAKALRTIPRRIAYAWKETREGNWIREDCFDYGCERGNMVFLHEGKWHVSVLAGGAKVVPFDTAEEAKEEYDKFFIAQGWILVDADDGSGPLD